MGSSAFARPSARTVLGVLLAAAGLLPGGCGGSTSLMFVDSSGGSGGRASGGEGGDDGGGGEGGLGGLGGAHSGGSSGGGTNTGGTGGTIPPTCGNGTTETGEACDEGGEDADNCDFDCTLAECGDGHTNEEAREACDDGEESAFCDDDCTAPTCGDGVLNRAAGEQCDDDDTDNGDGCNSTCERELLILGDGVSEQDAAELLRAAGFSVTIAPVLEYEYEGTDPDLDEFCGVIQFDGTYTQAMPLTGQAALVDYVEAGGGFMSAGWSSLEATYGASSYLSELLLLDYYGTDVSGTYAVTTEGTAHPVTANLPATFPINSHAESGTCKEGSVPLLSDGAYHGMCVSDDPESRRVASLGSAFGLAGYRPLQHFDMARLFLNAANWLCETDHPFPGISVGSTEVFSRFGYKAQCQAWDGDTCVSPWIVMNPDDVTDPAPHCIDDLTSLRPIWGYTIAPEAQTWCWIATGRASYVSAGYTPYDPENIPDPLTGWMYVWSATPECGTSPGRHPSSVNIPGVGPQTWSFDDFGYSRAGQLLNVACNWPEAP